MDCTGCAGNVIADVAGPGTGLVGTGGEKRQKSERVVCRADETVKTGLRQAKLGEKLRFFIVRHSCLAGRQLQLKLVAYDHIFRAAHRIDQLT